MPERAEFEEALRDSLSALPARDRALLHASVEDRESIDDLAARYGVSRSTTAHWLAAARETLTAETRRRLQVRLGLSPSELDSVAAVVRSQLNVSIVRLLADAS